MLHTDTWTVVLQLSFVSITFRASMYTSNILYIIMVVAPARTVFVVIIVTIIIGTRCWLIVWLALTWRRLTNLLVLACEFQRVERCLHPVSIMILAVPYGLIIYALVIIATYTSVLIIRTLIIIHVSCHSIWTWHFIGVHSLSIYWTALFTYAAIRPSGISYTIFSLVSYDILSILV